MRHPHATLAELRRAVLDAAETAAYAWEAFKRFGGAYRLREYASALDALRHANADLSEAQDETASLVT